MRGVVAIDPNAVNGPPPVVVEEAWANKVTLGRDGRTLVPAGSDTFDFTFTALSLCAPEQQRFKYRLEPYDKAWVDAGTRRTAHYTNMAPGEYSFQVIAANSFGVWNNQGAGVRFVLQPCCGRRTSGVSGICIMSSLKCTVQQPSMRSDLHYRISLLGNAGSIALADVG